VDGRQVVPLPDSLPATQAAPMMCAGLTIWAALQHEKIRSAAKIAILGAGGGLGHLGVQFAAHLGMEVLAVDVADQAISLLKHIRSDLGEAGKLVTVVDAQRSPPDHIKALAQGDNPASAPTTELGVDAVLMLPASQNALDLGLSILRNHGTMMVLSFPKDKLRISASDLVFRDINFVGSLVGRNHHLREMIEFAATHQIKAEVKPVRFIDINAMVDESRKGFAGKLVIDMTL
jgi:propanol-preferring alcohol dehydrogenase